MTAKSEADQLAQSLASVYQSFQDDPDGGWMTTAELMDMLGWGREKIWRSLRHLAAQGRLQNGSVRRMDISGRLSPVPAYRLRRVADDRAG